MGKTKLASDELAVLTERKENIQSAKGSLSDLYTACKGFANAFERVLRDSDLQSRNVSVSSVGVITAKESKSAAGKSKKSKSDKASKKLSKSDKVPAKKSKSKPKPKKDEVVDANATSDTTADPFDSSSDAPEESAGSVEQ